jgi:S1-C subfamily serine protease
MFVLSVLAFVTLALPGTSTSARIMEVGDAAIVRRASPAVVNIAEWKVHAATQPDQSPRRVKVYASGFVIDPSGIIVTNKHVIDGALDMQVIFSNGDRVPARLLAAAAMLDLAVVKVDVGHPLPALKWANSDALRIGDPVLTMGNPLGLGMSVSAGIVSALNRNLHDTPFDDYIQTDAAINRGNSGGPLLDTRGRLIGMNTAIASSTGENTGVGFAIPVDAIRRVVPQLIEKGKVIRPESGISRVYQTEQGLLIVTLNPGGPAERAGLRGFRIVRETKRRGPFTYEEKRVDKSQADLIVAVDGEKVTTGDAYLSFIERHQPGERAIITVAREGQLIDVPVTLGSSN